MILCLVYSDTAIIDISTFFFNDTATTEIYTLSLHDALPILGAVRLTNEFLQHDPPRKSELRRLRGFVEREIGRISGRIVRARPKAVIATSGTAAALAAGCDRF